jgi:hypothetical protein
MGGLPQWANVMLAVQQHVGEAHCTKSLRERSGASGLLRAR